MYPQPPDYELMDFHVLHVCTSPRHSREDVMSPRLRSLRSLSLGLRIIVSLRDTTAEHEREACCVLREA